jgi:hypothetical protein
VSIRAPWTRAGRKADDREEPSRRSPPTVGDAVLRFAEARSRIRARHALYVISHAEMGLVVVIVVVASFMARGVC